MSMVTEQHASPFAKRYFSQEMLEKYEPLQDSLQKFLDSDGQDENAWTDFQSHYKLYSSFNVFSNWDGKRYDVVMYGVSGYTGYLMMEYLKRVSIKRWKRKEQEEFTFAFAGRTASKVAEMRDREFKDMPEFIDVPVIRATFDDIVSMSDLARSARVLINVAGPYMLTEGEILIDACIHHGTHYCDISGEVPWSRRVVDMHEHASKHSSFVVPSAASAGGYPDMCIFYLADQMRQQYGEELKKVEVYCCGGGTPASASGGTLKTRKAMNQAGDEVRKLMGNVFALGGFLPARDRNGIKDVDVEAGTGKVSMKPRPIDLDANMARVTEHKEFGFWRGPYVYQYFDTRIVRRSNQLMADYLNKPYGRELNFLEYGLIPASIMAEMQSGGQKAKASVADEAAAAKAAGVYYKEGEGPPLEDLEDAWVSVFTWVQSTGGHEAKCGFMGRDGYFETARVAIELCMAILFDKEKLPFPGGVLPPALAGGHCIRNRIKASGHLFREDRWFDESEWKPPPFP